jgi:hypothetical protein
MDGFDRQMDGWMDGRGGDTYHNVKRKNLIS